MRKQLETLRRVRRSLPKVYSFAFARIPGLLKLTRWVIARNRQIVLLGGHSGNTFDDNGRAMALFLASDPGYKVYWATRRKTYRGQLSRSGISEVRLGSWRGELIATAAHTAYYSHGISDITIRGYRKMPWRIVVYLGHGVWGLKKIERRAKWQGRHQFDVTISVSEQERLVKASSLQCATLQVLPVGLPKHDPLIQNRHRKRSDRPRLKVLYAPTWRDWLQSKPADTAIQTHFSAFERLLASKPKYLNGSEYDFMYLVHTNIRGLASTAKEICDRYNVDYKISSDVDVNKLLRDADILITDYSALFWDFIVQDKIAVRYVFDRNIYKALTGSYEGIEILTRGVTFERPRAVWRTVQTEATRDVLRKIADVALPYSEGRSCERLAIAVDELLRGEQPSCLDAIPSNVCSIGDDCAVIGPSTF